MKNILILLLFLPQIPQAKPNLKERKSDLKERLPEQIYLESSEVDNSLKNNEAIYEFYFQTSAEEIVEEKSRMATFSYNIDGGETRTESLKDKLLVVRSTAGNHIFQFYYSSGYYEVYTDSLKIEPRHRDRYIVFLDAAEKWEMAEKPVIYLYPEARLDVSVKLDIHGENPFMYPAYNDGWKFTAEPNGDLIFGAETYNYLFWEAKTHTRLTPEQRATGFFVKGKDAITFLEEKLNLAGFTSKERADFITYWGPRLAQNELNFVHFEFNDACNQFAHLDISPKPNQVYRIYMLWGAVQSEFSVEPQEIERIDRTGFCVVEWGGQETHMKQPLAVK